MSVDRAESDLPWLMSSLDSPEPDMWILFKVEIFPHYTSSKDTLTVLLHNTITNSLLYKPHRLSIEALRTKSRTVLATDATSRQVSSRSLTW